MENSINFSGLSIEVGQMERGLISSPIYARNFFYILKNIGLNLVDRGDLFQEELSSRVKIFVESDLKKIHWNNYHQAYSKTISLLQENTPLINWGGDHSVAISTVGAFTHCFNDGYVIWIDAHADLNLPSKSLTGNLHGMPLAVLLNLEGVANDHFKWITQTLNPKKLIYLGLRDLDPFEKNTIAELGIKAFYFEDIQRNGIDFVAQQIVETVKDHPVHISFDIDSVDPQFAPSTGVPVEKGLTPIDLDILGKTFFLNLNIRSVDVVELNPLLGTRLEVDQTFITAFIFLKSIFTHIYPGDHYESMGKRDQTKRFDEMEWGI